MGIETSDDAAIYKVTDEIAMIQTVDFFTPIVDDPYTFGQIAAANSLSDVYAMGGEPKIALNIVGFPNCLDPEILGEILAGGADKVKEAGYGGIITYQSAYAFYSFFYQNECPVIDTSGETPSVVIDNEQGTEAWNYICDMITKGGLVESFKEATTWDKVYESFANGEATFLLGGDWCATGGDEINPDLDYGIATMVGGKTQATVLGGWTWNINANSKNPELAYDLIQYINSEKGDPILDVEGKISAR